MDATLLDLIAKNFGAFAGIVVGEVLAIVAIWRYFVAQVNKKDNTIDSLHSSTIDNCNKAHERMSAAIDKLDQNVEESNKLISNLLILLQERNKL